MLTLEPEVRGVNDDGLGHVELQGEHRTAVRRMNTGGPTVVQGLAIPRRLPRKRGR